jgi:hypothetical protein
VDELRARASGSGVLTDVVGMDEQHYIPLTGAMFSRGTVARAELATDSAARILSWPGTAT